jgi:hypothetical protein
MATLFVDYENGNDDYGGTSFALLASGADGRITSTTFSSVGASFPNDGSLINQYLSINNGTSYVVYQITAWLSSTSLTISTIPNGNALANQAINRQYYIGGRWKSTLTGASASRTGPGDIIRIKGSPAPTSLGIGALWTSGEYKNTISISGVSATTPIQITTTAAHGYTTGDTIAIYSVGGLILANGMWEITVNGATTFTLNNSVYTTGTYTTGGTAQTRTTSVVYLNSALTQNVTSTGQRSITWTPAANVTTTLTTTATREHYYGDSIAIGATFTTGRAAWFPTGLLNLSGYQQLSFHVSASTISFTSAGFSLCLCSDTQGLTIVNTIPVALGGLTSLLTPTTYDLGINFGSDIRSIALYVNVDQGAGTLVFSNIIACKASSSPDSLTLTSLIGKGVSGETFYGIQSINGRRVLLELTNTTTLASSASFRGYYGTTENVTTYKRETIKVGPSSLAMQRANSSGSVAAPILYSGGWDRTDMTVQNLETWTDGQQYTGIGFDINAKNNITLEKLAFAKFGTGCQTNTTSISNITLNIIAANNCSTGISVGFAVPTHVGVAINIGHSVNCSVTGATLRGVASSTTIQYGIAGCANGVEAAGDSLSFIAGTPGQTSYIASCQTGIRATTAIGRVSNLNFKFHSSNPVNCTIAAPMFFTDCNFDAISGTLEFAESAARYYSQNHDQTANNHRIVMFGGLITSATDQRHTASGISWKLQPQTVNRTQNAPVSLPIATIACAANSLVTVKAWMYRDNSGLTMSLVCRGGQIAGVPDNVSSSVAAVNNWEEKTITFTPTALGVVEITAEAWGGNTFSGWVDDMTISQA